MSKEEKDDRRGGSSRVVHARTEEEIDALLQRIRRDADAGAGLTAMWLHMKCGKSYVQIPLDRLDAEREAPPMRPPEDDIVQEVRTALQRYRDPALLDACALAGMLKTVVAARVAADGEYPCARALQELIERSLVRIDARPTRRSLTLRSVFEQICLCGRSQERSAEILHVEDRTIRRAMQEMAAALVKYWIETHELE
jgi:hypothetical protein